MLKTLNVNTKAREGEDETFFCCASQVKDNVAWEEETF